jgi:hypothetical protein
LGRSPKGTVAGQRLGGEHFERDAEQTVLAQRVDECRLVDHSAAAGVDEDCVRLELAEGPGVEHPLGLGGEPQRHDHGVG